MEFTQQSEFEVRLEWGHQGLAALAECELDALVIVDVLSFSTCVSMAVERGAFVFPYPAARAGGAAFAKQREAILAGSRSARKSTYSLAPSSLATIPAATKLVLPSPNGSSLSFEAVKHGQVIAGCLRNASAVAEFLSRNASRIAFIAAGERWPDGSLRPCFEDYAGAGAIVAALSGVKSPEAESAEVMFRRFRERILDALMSCSSGKELAGRGFSQDVEIASRVDEGEVVPVLTDGCYGQRV